jgi:pyrroline-5-carboxylate reductase
MQVSRYDGNFLLDPQLVHTHSATPKNFWFSQLEATIRLCNIQDVTMPQLQSSKVAFIGGGNMATAIISGLVSTGFPPKSQITVSEPLDSARAKLAALGIHATTSNSAATAEADIVVIAVKPQVTPTVCNELAAAWASRSTLPTVLSIAAGVTLDSLCEWLRTPDGRVPHIVRAMPNTPALVGEGAAGVFARPEVTEEEKQLVGQLLGSISHATEWVSNEGMLDVVTGLSGQYNASATF